MLRLVKLLLVPVIRFFSSRRDLLLENLALRQQLAVLKRRHSHPRLAVTDRLFWVILRRFWSGWSMQALILVLPETVVRWHRAGFRAVFDLAFAASSSRGQEVRQQRATRTYLPGHGRGESNLGCAAHSWRTKDAWLRHFRTDRVALDAESAKEFRSSKAMGGLSEQSSGSHRCDGFLPCRRSRSARCIASLSLRMIDGEFSTAM